MSDLIEALQGVTFDGDVPEDVLVADAIVILRLIDQATGRETFLVRNNEGISGIIQLGLMHCAMDIIGTRRAKDDDE